MNPQEMSNAQLTQAVAEEIMGWPVIEELVYPIDHISFCDGKFSVYENNNWQLWQPLTRPDDWWMVVERLASLDFDIRVDWYSDENNELYQAGWGVQFSKPDYEEDVIVKLKGMDAEDMAITLAQLKASQRAKTVQNIIIGRAVLEAALETDRRGQN